jgi:hypothetical protein
MASLLGVWILFLSIRLKLGKRPRLVLGSFGTALALAPLVVYGVSPIPALVLAAALAGVSYRHEIRVALERLRAAKTVEQNG